MLKKMASKSILFLGIFLVVATNVFSNDDEDLNIVVNYANPSAVSIAAAKAPPQAKAPTQPPPSQPSVTPLAPSPTSIVKSPKDCIPLCFQRCKFHLLKRLCVRSCMICCDRCKCVPPGHYGNRKACGKCYSDMKTLRNRFRCP
ncbi:gibberellin-regulated protein 14-like [Trifolium pratense]|uniref:Uncharacterized protein n=1 Tax=Trifolium pratense TaxID=57577 RepID=A0ACB0L807_TRIPR|nr:gibberellin-regulated protein 14-like [Trifolium pratense]CAJ2665520.1 unnamed protein product [Trifolium pratense]